MIKYIQRIIARRKALKQLRQIEGWSKELKKPLSCKNADLLLPDWL